MIYFHGTSTKINFGNFSPDDTGAMYFTNCPEEAFKYATKFETIQDIGTLVENSRIFKLLIEVKNSLDLEDHYSLLDIIYKNELSIVKELKEVIESRLFTQEDYYEVEDLMTSLDNFSKNDDRTDKDNTIIELIPFLTHSKSFNNEVLKSDYDSIIYRHNDFDKEKHHLIIFDNDLVSTYYTKKDMK